MSKIGEKIRTARKRANLSQQELAERIHINRSYLSIVEKGKSSPTYEFLEKVADGLKIGVEDLVLGKELSSFVRVVPGQDTMYEGLENFLNDREQMLMMNPSEEELGVLKNIRVDETFHPSKRFFVEALLDYRKTRFGR